jgi:flagellar hook-length control protein FliK
VAAQLANMAPAAATQANAAGTATQPVAAQVKPAGATTVEALKGTGSAAVATDAGSGEGTAVAGGTLPAVVAPRNDGQDTAQGQGSTGHRTDNQPASTPTALAPSIIVPATFASTLETAHVAETATRPAIDQAVLDQVVQNASIALRGGQQEFRVQLKPDFLGAMEVRVSMDNGVVAVRMSVESAATRQLIDNNIGQLRQAFGTDQVRVEHVPGFAGSDAAWSFGQGGQQGAWQGQNPNSGSGPLPEAIPFTGGFNVPATTVAPQAEPALAQSSARTAPGAIDLQA